MNETNCKICNTLLKLPNPPIGSLDGINLILWCPKCYLGKYEEVYTHPTGLYEIYDESECVVLSGYELDQLIKMIRNLKVFL